VGGVFVQPFGGCHGLTERLSSGDSPVTCEGVQGSQRLLG
jgi:hypothetical protein